MGLFRAGVPRGGISSSLRTDFSCGTKGPGSPSPVPLSLILPLTSAPPPVLPPPLLVLPIPPLYSIPLPLRPQLRKPLYDVLMEVIALEKVREQVLLGIHSKQKHHIHLVLHTDYPRYCIHLPSSTNRTMSRRCCNLRCRLLHYTQRHTSRVGSCQHCSNIQEWCL